ncbi:3-hydroxybutyrate dehydrogenase [Microbispora triticiradicis]|uniref:3-hydroxybutyrate dehydrogenase n=3 Tax=Microbispora TaxID=2005 RepID=A0ABY3M492_9ACTN|nr:MULTISPECIES: 3-hydroxybutyrate dehydrogenase [Microbispora]RGA00599.1 3-hydroxybutyrate dehydrogenase [Microbispora triticiradicis]TLP56908.1 3-hydroxybutyrate dehydrogenase [Microbispora fusca]TYB66863.1 3-hydroxybutyrate dehydrogenase [Microbispora tritici]GLW26318.1 3-hydroxybutyrate dehydrogenase [Microbispora amethystogenes]
MSLEGRTALVTGAGSGIGRACARRLAAEGAHVVVADVNAEAAGKVAAEIGGTPVTVDLSDPEFLVAWRGQLPPSPDTRLRADIVVNNAGFQHVAPIEEFPPEIFSAIMRVMVEAPFLLARAVLPGMYERGWGRIVNISSVHGLRASPYKAAYVTAKHALEGLSKVIALEGAAHGVTSNCVNPAYVRTPLVENQIADQARTHGIGPDEVVEQIMLAPAAIKRLIEPDEVAEMVAYLCGPAGSFVTGVSIPIDGGWSAR